MKIDSNANGNPLGYEHPHTDKLDAREKELYWSATQRAEDSLTKIWQIQEDRIDENGDINWRLTMDDFCELKEALSELDEAITYLNLIAKAGDWAERNKRFSESFRELCEAGVGTEEALDILNPGYKVGDALDE